MNAHSHLALRCVHRLSRSVGSCLGSVNRVGSGDFRRGVCSAVNYAPEELTSRIQDVLKNTDIPAPFDLANAALGSRTGAATDAHVGAHRCRERCRQRKGCYRGPCCRAQARRRKRQGRHLALLLFGFGNDVLVCEQFAAINSCCLSRVHGNGVSAISYAAGRKCCLSR